MVVFMGWMLKTKGFGGFLENQSYFKSNFQMSKNFMGRFSHKIGFFLKIKFCVLDFVSCFFGNHSFPGTKLCGLGFVGHFLKARILQ
jgi:hypothetical protein